MIITELDSPGLHLRVRVKWADIETARVMKSNPVAVAVARTAKMDATITPEWDDQSIGPWHRLEVGKFTCYLKKDSAAAFVQWNKTGVIQPFEFDLQLI